MKRIITIIISIVAIFSTVSCTTSNASDSTNLTEHPSNYILRSSASGLIEGNVCGFNIMANLSDFGTIFPLLPNEIQDQCIHSYQEITSMNKSKVNYGGITVLHPSDSVWKFNYGNNEIKITASKSELDKIFKYND